jgi:hypothetical protein
MSVPMNDSFLASVLLKIINSEPVGAEDMSRLQSIAASTSSALPELPTSAPNSAPSSPATAKKAPKKIKTLEAVAATPAAAAAAAAAADQVILLESSAPEVPVPVVETVAPEVPVPVVQTVPPEVPAAAATITYISYIPPPVDPKRCAARKVDDKSLVVGLPGTAKVFNVKQCVRYPAKGESLCPKCKEFQTKWSEGKDSKCKDWKGLLADAPLDCLPVVGSKWFRTTYENVRVAGAAAPEEAAVVEETGDAVSAPKLPETVLEDTHKVQEVKWGSLKLEGVNYIYNLKDRRIYRADITKSGEEQIMWEHFEGKWRNGEIDYYAEENEDSCFDD